MPNTITAKIDVTLIDKARLFVGREKNGHVPKYLDLILIPRKEVGKYGDTHLIKQSVSKEEREAKVEMPILGSATERGNAVRPQPAPAKQNPDNSDVPY